MHKVIKLAIASTLALSLTQVTNLLTTNLYPLATPGAGNPSNSEFEIKATGVKSKRASTYVVLSVPPKILSVSPFEIAVPKKTPNDFELDNVPVAVAPSNDNNDKTMDTKLDESNHKSAQSRHTHKEFEPNEHSTPEPEGVPAALNPAALNDDTQENTVKKAPNLVADTKTLTESIKSPAYDAVKFFLTVCTMVKNEAPYILEWIEFNRMQGVERIIIYDGGSADNVTLLNELYQQEEPSFPLVVLPSVEFIENDNLQRLNFQHCLDTYGPSTVWMANLDVDEFLYSPAFGTVASMLRNMATVERERNLSFTDFTSVNLNFGSSGQLHRFENRLTRGPDGRAVHENGCGLQLITDHVLRGPAAAVFGEPEATEYRRLTDGLWICELGGYFPPCRHNPGKAIFRPEAVAEAGIHVPDRMRRTGDGINWDTPLLIGNHYYYRSRDDVELKARQWRGGVGMPDHVRNYNLTDELLWSRTRDGALRRTWGEELARRVRGLTRTAGPCRHGVDRGAT